MGLCWRHREYMHCTYCMQDMVPYCMFSNTDRLPGKTDTKLKKKEASMTRLTDEWSLSGGNGKRD